jgi:protein arginine N-methyltransferase 1
MNYSVSDHLHMMSDPVRVNTYRSVIEKLVHPGSVVVDIGAGIGTLTLLACKYGARKVYAIEPDNLIQVARELVEANGFSDRVEFIQAMSSDVELPEKSDLVISDLRGSTPLFDAHIPSIIDARRRFLKPSGRLVPMSDRILAAAVCAPKMVRTQAPLESWSFMGLDFSLACDYVTNVASTTRQKPEFELTELMKLGEIDYRTVVTADFSGSATAVIERDGVMHGLCLWFETELASGIGYSTARREDDDCIYGALFLPWSEPLMVERGCCLDIAIRANLSGSTYMWDWSAVVKDRSGNQIIQELSQSSILGVPVSLDRLKRGAKESVPGVSVEGQALAAALHEMEMGRSVGEIGQALFRRFPQQFPSLQVALEKAADIAQKFGK